MGAGSVLRLKDSSYCLWFCPLLCTHPSTLLLPSLLLHLSDKKISVLFLCGPVKHTCRWRLSSAPSAPPAKQRSGKMRWCPEGRTASRCPVEGTRGRQSSGGGSGSKRPNRCPGIHAASAVSTQGVHQAYRDSHQQLRRVRPL